MLGPIRKHSRSFVVYLVIGGLSAIFAINFGPGSGSCSPSLGDWAAQVDGQPIERRDFVNAYQRRLDTLRRNARQSGRTFTDEMARNLGVRKQVADALVEKKLLASMGESLGFRVSNNELRDFLQKTYGAGDVEFDVYEGWVNSTFDASVAHFEDMARQDILAQKVYAAITDNLHVAGHALKETYTSEHNRLKLQFARFDPSDAKVDIPSDAEVDAHLKSDLKAVEDYFESHRFAYKTPKQVRTTKLAIALPQDANDAQKTAGKTQLLAAQKRILAGEDAQEVAQSLSAAPAATIEVEDLGWVSPGQLAGALSRALFTLKEKQASKPLETRQGLGMVFADEIKPAAEQAFDKVQNEVARAQLLEQKRDAAAKQQAQALLDAWLQGQDAQTKLDSDPGSNKALETSPWLMQGQLSIPKLGQAEAMVQEAFALTQMPPQAAQANEAQEQSEAAKPAPITLPTIHKVGRAFVVGQVQEREYPSDEEFAEQKDSLRKSAEQMRRYRTFQAWLENRKEQADVRLQPELFGQAS